MVVLDTDFALVTFDKEKKLGIVAWKGKANSEQYQQAFLSLLDLQKNEKMR